VYQEAFEFSKIISSIGFGISLVCSLAYILCNKEELSKVLFRVSIAELFIVFICVSIVQAKAFYHIVSLLAASSTLAVLSNLCAAFHYDQKITEKCERVSLAFMVFLAALFVIATDKQSMDLVKILSAVFFMMSIVNGMFFILAENENVRSSSQIVGLMSIFIACFGSVMLIVKELHIFIVGFLQMFFAVSLFTAALSAGIAVFYPGVQRKKRAVGVAVVSGCVSLLFKYMK
jgi:hypothetical protein